MQRWIKANPIPADQSRWDVYAKLEADNERFCGHSSGKR